MSKKIKLIEKVVQGKSISPVLPKHIKNLSPYKPGKTIDSVKKKYNLDRIIKLASKICHL